MRHKRFVKEITARLRRGGRLIYVGAGTSGRLGVVGVAECPPLLIRPLDWSLGVIARDVPALTHTVEHVEDSKALGRC